MQLLVRFFSVYFVVNANSKRKEECDEKGACLYIGGNKYNMRIVGIRFIHEKFGCFPEIKLSR
jgi:hypothetical protein